MGTVKIHLVTVPLPGAVEELVVDRRTAESWTARDKPFAVADTVVTSRPRSALTVA